MEDRAPPDGLGPTIMGARTPGFPINGVRRVGCKAYSEPMAQPKPSPGERANAMRPGVERVVAMGMELVRTAKQAAMVPVDPVEARERQMTADHQLAVTRSEVALRKHHFQITGLKTQAVAAGAGAVVLGASAVELGADGGVFAGILAAGSAALAVRARLKARRLTAAPPTVPIPPLPPARLRAGARGSAEAARVHAALLHLYDVMPSVAALHPEAAGELARALADVEPLLRGQVERLAALDRIEWDMPGSAPAWAAAKGGEDITARLVAGATALEGLITAAAQMLAAPDLVDGVDDLLLPAIDSLEAYAFGLHAANQSRSYGIGS